MSKSPSSRAPTILSLTLLTMLSVGLSACVQAPPVSLTVSNCRKLIPDEWRKGVASAPLPTDKSVGKLAAFGEAQTGQLDIANSRFSDADEIQRNCESLLLKAAADAQPSPWWKFW